LKIRVVGGELFYAHGRTDRQTDLTKRLVMFCNFTNEPKKGWKLFEDSSDFKVWVVDYM